ncbi:MAG: hypothetical protein AAB334_02305 [Patescibacteria group bacterium]
MQNQEQKEGQLEKLYEQLPQNVQEAISSVAVAEKIQQIATKNGLHIDEAGIVSDEATMVMLGIEHPNDFVDGLKNKLKLPQEKIIALAKDVDKEIFEPIKESLMKIYQNEENLIADERDYAFASQIDADKKPQINADDATNLNENENISIPINKDGSIKKEMTTEELGQKLMEEDAIFKNKTENIVNLPREETITKDNVPVRTESKIKHIDPYREPTE